MGSVIRLAAIIMSGFVLFGFAFFAADELDRGSKTQQRALSNELEGVSADPAPIARTPRDEAVREAASDDLREIVDDVNDVLLGPFVDLVDSDDAWVARGVPTLLALLLYGVGLGFLANMLPKRRSHGADWRGAES
ncbi:MAG TPA: hypothetical protein VG126_05255 [Thermoleophilaceae bacterium]|nr:hypothetical protein [Thermoleophilaceae bacterium]